MGDDTKPRICLECHLPTTGCVTKSGYRIAVICQPCKDKADVAAEAQLKIADSFFNKIFGQ